MCDANNCFISIFKFQTVSCLSYLGHRHRSASGLLPDVNELGSGKRRWNLANSSAYVEFCLRTVNRNIREYDKWYSTLIPDEPHHSELEIILIRYIHLKVMLHEDKQLILTRVMGQRQRSASGL